MGSDFLLKIRSSIDRRSLASRFPFFANLPMHMARFTSELRPVYRSYVATVSTPDMAISLSLASLALGIALETRPKTLLDLGSGFSSYAFRRIIRPSFDCRIVTVDDSPDWLSRTEAFLKSEGESVDDLYTLSTFRHAPPHEHWDLILYDLGRMPVRIEHMPWVLTLPTPGYGFVLVDDLHKAAYRRQVSDTLRPSPMRLYNLRNWTLDEWGRWAGLVVPGPC